MRRIRDRANRAAPSCDGGNGTGGPAPAPMGVAKVRGTAIGQMGMMSNGLSNGLDGNSAISRSGEHVAQRRPLSMRQAAAKARREFMAGFEIHEL